MRWQRAQGQRDLVEVAEMRSNSDSNGSSQDHREAVDLHTVLREELGQRATEPLSKSFGADAATPAKKIVGLALSGGGIRSATFSLGVLQALASKDKLASFDYLSTVSGGGYIGSWLSAWIHRSSLHKVQEELKRHGATVDDEAPVADEPKQVTWLRRYSNYLTPRVGLFSLDSLTLVCTWLRNVMLNLIIILGGMGFLFVLPYALLEGFSALHDEPVTFGFAAAWSGLVAMGLVGWNFWHQSMPIKRGRNWLVSTPGVIMTAVLPAVLAAIFASVWVFHPARTVNDGLLGIRHVGVLLLVLLFLWLLCEAFFRKSDPRVLAKELFRFFVAGAGGVLAGALVLVALEAAWDLMVKGDSTRRLVFLIALGPPALLVALGVATSVYTGLVGRVFFERTREWWSRLNAWLLIVAVVWAAWGALAFFSLPLLQWLHDQGSGSWSTLLGTGWVGALLTSIFFKKPESASEKTQLRVERALDTAANVFVIGLLVVVSAFASWAVTLEWKNGPPTFEWRGAVVCEFKPAARDAPTPSTKDTGWVDQQMARVTQLLGPRSTYCNVSRPAADLLVLAIIVLLFGFCVDINKFSLHNMYKNRLIRCYLGASNKRRNQQQFTGLDDEDDFALRKLGGSKEAPVQRPFHILNTALNISQGSNLAWQERKAASFVLTPLYCGFALAGTQGDSTSKDIKGDDESEKSLESKERRRWKTHGFCRTEDYASDDPEEQGFSLGMAMATSGAAVSPNMGQATRPARAFVLTMFNIRLGRWSPNPRGSRPKVPSPRAGFVAMTLELFGYSNEDRDFVYLSDGGHFDNLGLYELVRRRCDVIVAVDAGADPKREFNDLAEAIRKCRIDMGVEISIPLADLAAKDGDLRMRSKAGFAKGTIKYGDGLPDGKIVLIKPSMCAGEKEPADVLNYAQQNRPFPQQTTGDQFFGESQFESYRRLGLHITNTYLDDPQSWLPTLPASVFEHKDDERLEEPTRATQWMRPIVGSWCKPGSELPKRDGSLVDHCVLAALGSLALWFLIVVIGGLLTPAVPGLCLSSASCEAAVNELLSAKRLPFWCIEEPRYITLTLDNFFIVAYLATFVMTFVIATRGMKKRLRFWVMAGLCSLAVVTACVDYLENFSLFAQIARGLNDEPGRAHIAEISRLKSVLAVVCLLIVLPMQYLVFKDLRARWKG